MNQESAMSTDEPATILCVDDEPHVLSSLKLHLQRHYRVLSATSGAEGIRLLRAHPEIAVVMSDMRMPGMDGATFLHAARSLIADAPRLLLTGHADIDTAVAAVNDGQIFRFLLKPCPPATVAAAFEAALRQRRLIDAERALLEQTLTGAVRTLSDVLAMTRPAAFGSAVRIKQLALELASQLRPGAWWTLEVAAMLLPLGCVALPTEVADRLHNGRAPDAAEREMLDRLPGVTESMLAAIPRLEPVRAMLATVAGRAPADAAIAALADDESVRLGAAILRVAADFDALDLQGIPADAARASLHALPGRYDAAVLAALDAVRTGSQSRGAVREIAPAALRTGMVIANDVRLASGVLLVARGFTVTPGLIEHIRNLRSGALTSPIWVYPDAAAGTPTGTGA
jgi:response regulator RpfG family c-di-GMP phosphodiesterase